mgnify:CR=1 FL=1
MALSDKTRAQVNTPQVPLTREQVYAKITAACDANSAARRDLWNAGIRSWQAEIEVQDAMEAAQRVFRSQFKRAPTPGEVAPIWQELLKRGDMPKTERELRHVPGCERVLAASLDECPQCDESPSSCPCCGDRHDRS